MPRDLRLLPKAHLHIHLDGALRASTLAELSSRSGFRAPTPSSFGSFSAFTDTITAAAKCLQTADDVHRVLGEICEDAASSGAVWMEISFWPGLFDGRLGTDFDAVDMVAESARRASHDHDVGIGLIVAANRDHGPEEALRIAKLAATHSAGEITGFGLDGDESRHPPGPFADSFAVARAAGLKAVPHAGELLGPQSVAVAVDVLGADRIMHGVRCVEDPALVARLAASNVVLDICPTSNVLLSVAPSLEQHPLPALLEAGVACSSAMFRSPASLRRRSPPRRRRIYSGRQHSKTSKGG
ncbi:adenosine deaminase [Mycobacterium sp. 21AC1]|uniref:adenosine deaminase n=1 Tax=[Mycobacterium] appelbergii TaxID=2939269 RepID=UPI002938E943|nr:adenosine deaminase [Mycobacterium sp. 21AC1]MDV3123631.1 adenosine deaminase [Mycobacterium sp. 21AC1]